MHKEIELISFINDRFVPASEARLPLNDLGFQRGYGIFDFLRVAGSVPLYKEDHLNRFFHSAREMRLPVNQTRAELESIIDELIQKNSLPHSGIRIMLSGGASPDGFRIVQPNLAIVQVPIVPPPDEIVLPGYKVVTYPHQRQMPHIKTTDYLMAIWLQPWVQAQGADEVLYQQNGMVSEFPRSNFFMVTNEGTLVTPGRNVLYGVTRKQILQVAAANGIDVSEKDISLTDISLAKEAFITSSTKRVIPIRQLDETIFKPCTSDSVTAKLFRLLQQHEITTAAQAH
ncbi:MAG: aminotransferase class IV [Bacteroidota bacterium]